jgi:hypothetical protein
MEDETRHWLRLSHKAKLATVIIFTVLGILSVVFGLIYYHPPAPSNSNWICPSSGQGPCFPRETLSLESSQTNSSTNMTLQLKNTSSVSIAICYYMVEDTTNQQYTSNTNPVPCGPSMAPGTSVSFIVLIDGKLFTFNTGSTYTIGLVTTRNNEIRFSVRA